MKIISFEGIEGVGKSTQIDLLHDYLLNEGKSVKKFREPGSTIPSEKIRNILLDANLTLTSQTELLLMYASRSELVANEIQSNQHDFILLDRYFDASMAYQGYGRNLDKDFINSLSESIKAFFNNIISLSILLYRSKFLIEVNFKSLKNETLGLSKFDK